MTATNDDAPDIFKGHTSVEVLAWDRGWQEASRQARALGALGPALIVVQVGPDAWKIAERDDAIVTTRYGPTTVITYRVVPGLPYATRQKAVEDAALTLARLKS